MKQSAINTILTCSEKMNQFCSPLMKHFEAYHVAYLKIFPDMSRIHLDTNAKWTEFFYKHIEKYYQANLTEGYHWESGYSHLFSLEDSCIEDAILHDVGDGIVVSRHKNGITELLFVTHQWSQFKSSKVGFLMRNIDLLEKFLDYFTSAASDLIQKAEKNRIITPFIRLETERKLMLSSQELQIRENFSNELKKLQKINLTKRQIDCIRYSALDLSAKEVANRLNISPKTVEHHLENAKRQLGFSRKSALIKYFLENY